jgi:hypothetical protein
MTMSTVTTTTAPLSTIATGSRASNLEHTLNPKTISSKSAHVNAPLQHPETNPRGLETSPAQGQSRNQLVEEQFILENVSEATFLALSKTETVLIIFTLTGITFANSMSTGLFTIGIPRIAVDIKLPENLLLWLETNSTLTLHSR